MTGGWGGYTERDEAEDREEAAIQKRIDAAIASARAEAIEEAAKVADAWGERIRFPPPGSAAYGGPMRDQAICSQASLAAAEEISEAIRTLKERG